MELRHDLWFWCKLCGIKFKKYSFKALFEKYGSVELCSDCEFMIETCRKCADIFPLVERTLASDRNFLELVLDQSQNADVLQLLSHETQQLRQDLGIKGIPCFSRDRKERATYCTAEAMGFPYLGMIAILP